MDHLPVNTETLIRFAEGTLPEDQREAVEQVVACNAAAAEIVRLYQQTARAMAADDSVEPPVDVVRKAKAIFDPADRPSRATLRDAVATVIARLVFDSRVQPAMVRGSATGDQVLLTYEIDDVELDIQITRTESGAKARRVIGQFAADETESTFKLSVYDGGEQPILEQNVTPDQPFTLDLDPGSYEFRAALPNRIVVFPDIDCT